MDNYYPKRARRREQGGWALLRCRVTPPERTWNGSKVEGRQEIAVFDWAALDATYTPIYRDAPN